MSVQDGSQAKPSPLQASPMGKAVMGAPNCEPQVPTGDWRASTFSTGLARAGAAARSMPKMAVAVVNCIFVVV